MLQDKFINGLLVGIALPLLAFGLIYVFDQALITSESVNITGNAKFLWTGFKRSTLVLIALCFNLIPTYFANKNYKDEFIRGIMLPTVVYCFIWFFYYKAHTIF